MHSIFGMLVLYDSIQELLLCSVYARIGLKAIRYTTVGVQESVIEKSVCTRRDGDYYVEYCVYQLCMQLIILLCNVVDG